jgi:hypothetical protein
LLPRDNTLSSTTHGLNRLRGRYVDCFVHWPMRRIAFAVRPAVTVKYTLRLFGLMVVASGLTTLVHELVGHLGVAHVFLAPVNGITIFPDASGYAHFDDRGLSVGGKIAAQLGGIGVNLVTGVLALSAVRRIRRPTLALATAMFAGASLVGALHYLTVGLYDGCGDPGTALGAYLRMRFKDGPVWHWTAASLGFWAFPLALSPVVGYLCVREYLFVQDRVLPCATTTQRFFMTLRTLGVGSALLIIVIQSVHAWAPSRTAVLHCLEEGRPEEIADGRFRRERFFRLCEQERRVAPQLSDLDVVKRAFAFLRRHPLPLERAELVIDPPIWPVFEALLYLGALGAILRPVRAPRQRQDSLDAS